MRRLIAHTTQIPALTDADTRALLAAGNRTEIARRSIRYVGRLARNAGEQFRVNPDEIMGAGMTGVYKALRSYDPAAGVPFLAYAAPAIRQALIAEIRLLRTRETETEDLDSVVDPDTLEMERDTIRRLDGSRAVGALARLSPRRRTVLEARYGEDKTLAEVGAQLGLTKERARQIEAGALAQMRRTMEET